MYHEAVYMIVTPAVSRGFLSRKNLLSNSPRCALFHNFCCVEILYPKASQF